MFHPLTRAEEQMVIEALISRFGIKCVIVRPDSTITLSVAPAACLTDTKH